MKKTHVKCIMRAKKKGRTTMEHCFKGKWITNEEFAALPARSVFHPQLVKVDLPCQEHRNRHLLFRKSFLLESHIKNAQLYITADDYYKLYINGVFVGQGPAPSYHFSYNYNVIDITSFLKKGKNVIAVHTLYQGLINRVWQSGDWRHGLLLDLEADGKTLLCSDESFKVALHTGYTETGTCGYETQFLERYDAGAPEADFAALDFDDSTWKNASVKQNDDHVTVEQKSASLVFETKKPTVILKEKGRIILDFGACYVGYLQASAKGKKGDIITVRCAQERAEAGIRFDLRANCRYEEEWVLRDGESRLDWFDYKSFRYAELLFPEEVALFDITLTARHYPFHLAAKLKDSYANDEDLKRIWELCVNTQKYGVQEVIQDCMEREKGFYLGDGCYTALTHMLLCGEDSMVKKLIDDAFSTDFISDTLVTCMDCSFMQEIAEYPLMLISLVLWHYRITKDAGYLKNNYPKVIKLLEAYRSHYEKEFLLRDLDKWCVVEWPANFRHGYDVDIAEGKVCHEAHVSINAYYIEAIRNANRMASALALPPYREEEKLLNTFYDTFYNKQEHLFRDGENTDHISLVGNSFAYAFDLFPDETGVQNFLALLEKHGISSLSFFCTFPILARHAKDGREELLLRALKDEGAWKRMLREDTSTTFEGWGKDTKWNTSLFHLTMSFGALFLLDTDLKDIF